VATRFLLCRPENSLLAEDLEYDSAVRQAPVFTEEVARKLEDIIRLIFYLRRIFSAGMLA
jgi:U3 small nucleolar ribonucleoprotein component